MSCFRPVKKLSEPNKPRRGLISTLQKKLKRLGRTKSPFNQATRCRLQHHRQFHPYGGHFKHYYHCPEDDDGVPNKNMEKFYVEPFFIESNRAEYLGIVRETKTAMFSTRDDDHREGYNKAKDDASLMEIEDDEVEEDNGGENDIAINLASYKTSSMAVQHHEVDAIAEKFISKMKRSWKLERQKSVEDYIQNWKPERQKPGEDCSQSWKIEEEDVVIEVDANAELFINKMKGSWKLEKQKSDEDDIQRWARLYKC